MLRLRLTRMVKQIPTAIKTNAPILIADCKCLILISQGFLEIWMVLYSRHDFKNHAVFQAYILCRLANHQYILFFTERMIVA
jgi:hypothetical protein